MHCRICGEDINEKEQDNVSPFIGYPVCEDCKDDIMCDECCDTSNLLYIEEWNKVLCRDCVVREAESRELIHSVTHYYTQEYSEICSDADLAPVVEHLKDFLNVQEMNNN